MNGLDGCRKPSDLLLLRIKRSLLAATFHIVGSQEHNIHKKRKYVRTCYYILLLSVDNNGGVKATGGAW